MPEGSFWSSERWRNRGRRSGKATEIIHYPFLAWNQLGGAQVLLTQPQETLDEYKTSALLLMKAGLNDKARYVY